MPFSEPTWDRLRYILLESETVAVRAFFALISLGYAIFMLSIDRHTEYTIALAIMPHWLWSIGFLVHGLAVWYGIMSQKHSLALLMLEGVLGAGIWITLGICTSASQGMPGPTLMASTIAVWQFVRYPRWM